MQTQDLVDDFLAHLKARNMKPKTLLWYADLRRFAAACPELPLTPEPIERFLGDLECSDETKFAYWRRLRALYQFARQRPVPRTFEDFIAQNDFALAMGFYHSHTMRYLDRFAPEQLHYIVYDDISSQPERVVAELYGFLGAATDWRPEHLQERVNVRMAPRSAFVRHGLGMFRALLESSPKAPWLMALGRRLRLWDLVDRIHNKNLAVAPFTPMKPETRKRLQAIYAEQNLLLGELLGRDLSHWNE